MKNPYEQAKEFHDVFHPVKHQEPTPFDSEEALHRASFKAEELVEFLYAASANDDDRFKELTEALKSSIDDSVLKVQQKQKAVENPLVEQVDALVDTLYFTFGSLALMKVDPIPIFSIVHNANMNKLFPDGKVHYHPVTGKVMKPNDWEEKYAPEKKIAQEIERQRKQINK